MKTKIIVSAFALAFLCVGMANAQIAVSTQRASLTDVDRTILDQRVSRHTAFTIDKRQLTNYLNSRSGAGQIRLRIDENMDWTINLELNDLRTPDFRSTFTTDEGEFECEEPFVVNTFQGRTSTGMPVAFTIDENTFFGVILGENYHYVIRPVQDFTQSRTDTRLIAYHSWDIVLDENYSHFIHDAINDALHTPRETLEEWIEQDNMMSIPNNCGFVLRVATDADYEFFNIHGTNTNNRIMSVMNIVGAAFNSQIASLRLAVSFQHVYTSHTQDDPQTYTETQPQPLLNQIRNHWRTHPNRINVNRNVVHVFTGKNITLQGLTVLGAAWSPFGIGNDRGYAFSVNHAHMQYTVMHEIGHNLTATHPPIDVNANCRCFLTNLWGQIIVPLQPYPGRSVMCQGSNITNLWLCSFSINEINTFLSNNNDLLACMSISGFHTLCTQGVYTYEIVNFPLGAATTTWVLSPGISYVSSTNNTIRIRRSPSHADGGEHIIARVNLPNGSTIPLTKQIHIGRPNVNHISTSRNRSFATPGVAFTDQISYTGWLLANSNPYNIVMAEWLYISGGNVTIHNIPSMVNIPGERALVAAQFLGSNTTARVQVRLLNSCGWSPLRMIEYFRPAPPPPICLNCFGAGCHFCQDNPPCECGGVGCWMCMVLLVHPNPVSDVLTIDLTQIEVESDVFSRTQATAEPETIFSIRLLNAHGMVVRQQRTQARTIQFDVSNLPEGTYYLHIEHGGEIEKHQIIVQRN